MPSGNHTGSLSKIYVINWMNESSGSPCNPVYRKPKLNEFNEVEVRGGHMNQGLKAPNLIGGAEVEK